MSIITIIMITIMITLILIVIFSAAKPRFRHRANHFTKKRQRNIWSNINWIFNYLFKNMIRHKIFFESITKYEEWRQEPPKMRKSSDRGTESEPKSTNSEPKGDQRQVNRSQNSTKMHPNIDVWKRLRKDRVKCIKFLRQFGAKLRQKYIQNCIQKSISKKYGHLWEITTKLMPKRGP